VFPARIKDPRPGRRQGLDIFPGEHVLKKLTGFFDSGMLHLLESERFLFDQMIPSDWEAL
jgi:hypothetical protein